MPDFFLNNFVVNTVDTVDDLAIEGEVEVVRLYVAGVLDALSFRRTVLLGHAASTWFMVGLIWTIHLLHYPLLGSAGEKTLGSSKENVYVALQREHVDAIGQLLLVPWLTEGITLLIVLFLAFGKGERSLRIPSIVDSIGMAIVLVISGVWSAPAHGILMDRFDQQVFDRLMIANLVRTLAWTLCGVASLWMIATAWRNNEQHASSQN